MFEQLSVKMAWTLVTKIYMWKKKNMDLRNNEVII